MVTAYTKIPLSPSIPRTVCSAEMLVTSCCTKYTTPGLHVVDECRGERNNVGDAFVLLANNGNKTEGEVSETHNILYTCITCLFRFIRVLCMRFGPFFTLMRSIF